LLAVATEGVGRAYTLEWPYLQHIPDSWELQLMDLTTGDIIDLRQSLAYSFIATGESARFVHRFKLRVRDPSATSIRKDEEPTKIELMQNYPNPFNPLTQIVFRTAEPDWVILEVFDVLGRQVALLKNEYMPSGLHTVSWNAGTFSSGIYLYRLQTGGVSVTKSMLLLK
jgi:hypothetical protein